MTTSYRPPHMRDGFTGSGASMDASHSVYDARDTLLLERYGFTPRSSNGDCADWWNPGNGYPHLHFNRTARNVGSSLKFLVISYGQQGTKRSLDLVRDGRLAPTYQRAIGEVKERWGDSVAHNMNELMLRYGLQVGE